MQWFTDVFQRSFHLLVGCWPVLLIRVVEQLILLTIFAVTFIFLGGLTLIAAISDVERWTSAIPDVDLTPGKVFKWIFIENADVVITVILALTIALLVTLAVHAFVQGGSVGAYLEAERRRVEMKSWQTAQEAFSWAKFVEDARASWWPIFWIYNVTWGLAGLVVLLPLAVAALVLVAAVDEPILLVPGCALLIFELAWCFVVTLLTWGWTNAAMTAAVDRRKGAADALAVGKGMLRANWLGIVFLALIFFAASLFISSVISAMTTPFAVMKSIPLLSALDMTVQLGSSAVQVTLTTICSTLFVTAVVSLYLREVRSES